MAKELSLNLFRIDLVLMMSGYIGETEKNLSMIFDAAEQNEIKLIDSWIVVVMD